MAEERNYPAKESKPNAQSHSTDEVIQRHLQDENHVITEEEMQNVKIGFTNEATQTGAEAQAMFEEEIKEEDTNHQGSEHNGTDLEGGGQRLTSWDVTT